MSQNCFDRGTSVLMENMVEDDRKKNVGDGYNEGNEPATRGGKERE